jgi:hypothetical protein
MRRLALLMAILGFATTAEALTVRDVIELSRAGLGEEVLLALVEVDAGVYAIDAETLKSLKQAGVPERVIAAMVRSGRGRLPDAPSSSMPSEPAAPQPQVVVIDHRDEAVVREVMVPVPVYVAVPIGRSGYGHGRARRPDRVWEDTYVPFQSGRPVVWPAVPPPPREPVYWGFGGRLRPDAWQPHGPRSEQPRSDRR